MRNLLLLQILSTLSFALSGPASLSFTAAIGDTLTKTLALSGLNSDDEVSIAFKSDHSEGNVLVLGDYNGFASTLSSELELSDLNFIVAETASLPNLDSVSLVIWNHYGPDLTIDQFELIQNLSDQGIPQIIGLLNWDSTGQPQKRFMEWLEISRVKSLGLLSIDSLDMSWAVHIGQDKSLSHSYSTHQNFVTSKGFPIVRDSSGAKQTNWFENQRVFLSGERLDGWWGQNKEWLISWIKLLSHRWSAPLKVDVSSNSSKNIDLKFNPINLKAGTFVDTLIVRGKTTTLTIPLTLTLSNDTKGPTFSWINQSDSFNDGQSAKLILAASDPSGISNWALIYSQVDSLLIDTILLSSSQQLDTIALSLSAGPLYFQLIGSDNQSSPKSSSSKIFNTLIADDDILAPSFSNQSFAFSNGGAYLWIKGSLFDSSGIFSDLAASKNDNPKIQFDYNGNLSDSSSSYELFKVGDQWESAGKWPIDSISSKFKYRILAYDDDADQGRLNDRSLLISPIQKLPDSLTNNISNNRLSISLVNSNGNTIDGKIYLNGIYSQTNQGKVIFQNGFNESSLISYEVLGYTAKSFTVGSKSSINWIDTLYTLGNLDKGKSEIIDTKDFKMFWPAYFDKTAEADIAPLYKSGDSWLSTPDGVIEFDDLLAMAKLYQSQSIKEPPAGSGFRKVFNQQIEIESTEGKLIVDKGVKVQFEKSTLSVKKCSVKYCEYQYYSVQPSHITLYGQGRVDMNNDESGQQYYLQSNINIPNGWKIDSRLLSSSYPQIKVKVVSIEGKTLGYGTLLRALENSNQIRFDSDVNESFGIIVAP